MSSMVCRAPHRLRKKAQREEESIDAAGIVGGGGGNGAYLPHESCAAQGAVQTRVHYHLNDGGHTTARLSNHLTPSIIVLHLGAAHVRLL